MENVLAPINTSPSTFNIDAVIFFFSGSINIDQPARGYKNAPKIISFVRLRDIAHLKNQVYPAKEGEVFAHSHEFIEHCDLMRGKQSTFLLIVLMIWGLVGVLHFTWTWILYKQHSAYIQKLLIFPAVFYIIDTLIEYTYWKNCPWVGQSGESIRYLQIVQIALVTVFNTFFVGLCVFLSKGWALMRTQFTRDELSSMSMIVAIFYLVYSAYFIASDIASLKVVIVTVLAIMHLWVVISCAINIRKNLSILGAHIRSSAGDETVIEVLKLKRFMMIALLCSITFIFLNKVIYSILYTFIQANTVCRNLYLANMIVQLVLIVMLLYYFRSRKWPDFFTVDMQYQLLENNAEQVQKPPVMSNEIPQSWLTAHKNSNEVL